MTLVDTETGEILETRLAKALRLRDAVRQGVAAFVEVGLALIAIKADRLYIELGYQSFDAYCAGEHGIGHSRRAQLMVAASIAESILEDSPTGEIPTPQREAQVRPLAKLDDPIERREAWLDALDAADGEQPTGQQVEEAVASRLSTNVETPAPVSEQTEALAEAIAADPDYQRATFRLSFGKDTPNVYRITHYSPADVVDAVSPADLDLIGQQVADLNVWWEQVQQVRSGRARLRSVPGGH